MASKTPLRSIKNLATESLKVPVSAAGSALGLAKDTAASASGRTARALASLVGGRKGPNPPAPAPVEQSYAATPPPAARAEEVSISPDEPVNVTEELGLDPAPVAKPKRTPKAAKKPPTSIDAAADPSDVHVTPADVAKAVSPGGADQQDSGQPAP